MTFEFWFPNPPVEESVIMSFETFVGCKLPDSYREFLALSNGGEKPKLENFTVLETGERTMLSTLYSLAPDGKGELFDEYLALRQEIPADLISIGHDIGGNKLCLAIQGSERGKLLFYDHELRSFNRKSTRKNFNVCANSFVDFLQGLN
ncbi:SMI1/KNR4 family protein [Prosthecobacter sp. SYSU 5D2]|uniref:SMI1/KNR4 family protein n=1 Tax=Prosthecobacter sp. SYSU 5D2 TaxID=3134134 RepID=UPI0031FE4BA2